MEICKNLRRSDSKAAARVFVYQPSSARISLATVVPMHEEQRHRLLHAEKFPICQTPASASVDVRETSAPLQE